MFCLSRIHEFFIIICKDGEWDVMLEPRWEFTQIHEFIVICIQLWGMGNMEELTKNMENIEHNFLSITNSRF